MGNKKWMKARHRVVRNLAYCVLYPYSKLKYGITIEKLKEKERPLLVLYNHQTAFDQFFVGMALKGPVYYVASEDLFSKGFVSSIIRYVVAPIPIKKQTLDITAIKTCFQVAREGGSIAIAPEGNRTFSGKTEYMSPAIASLARKLKLPIALYRLEGGYGVHPRWSDVVRKGKMRGYVSRIIEPEEYSGMTNEQLFEAIEHELYVNEANSENSFIHDKRAEFLERAMYVCPYCGLSSFRSEGHVITCEKCKRQVEYGEDTALSGIGFDFPYPFVSQWYDAQKDYINLLDLEEFSDKAMYVENVRLDKVILNSHKEIFRKETEISLFGDKIIFDGDLVFRFDTASAVTILGKNKLNIYYGGEVYQVKGGKRFNALKFVHIFNRYKNIRRGEKDEQFLGL